MSIEERSGVGNESDRLALGIAEFRRGNYTRSAALFERAASESRRNAEAFAWLAAAYGRQIDAVWGLSEKVALLKKLDRALEAALRIDPRLPLARRMNGARLLNTPEMLGGDPAAAAAEFRYCIAHGMDGADVWVLLAESYLKTGDRSRAADALNEAFAREPGHAEAEALRSRMARDAAE